MAEGRDSSTAYLLWALGFIGMCGFHRFYLDRPVSGILWFMTGGLCWIGQLIDLFYIPEMIRTRNMELEAHRQQAALPPGSIIVLPTEQRARVEQPLVRRTVQQAPVTTQAGPPLSVEEQLQVELTRLAQARGGVITVADGVVGTGRPPREIQTVLDAMARDGYVDMDINPETGAILYAFRTNPRERS